MPDDEGIDILGLCEIFPWARLACNGHECRVYVPLSACSHLGSVVHSCELRTTKIVEADQRIR